MNSRNRLHVEFSNRGETVVAFSHDRGVLKTNTWGDYFFRGTTDNRFCCCSPELERKLIDMGVIAGERVAIRKTTRGRIATWEVRRMDAPVAEASDSRRVQHTRQPIPDCKYSEPPVPVFPEVDEPAPARYGVSDQAPAQAVLPTQQRQAASMSPRQTIFSPVVSARPSTRSRSRRSTPPSTAVHWHSVHQRSSAWASRSS